MTVADDGWVDGGGGGRVLTWVALLAVTVTVADAGTLVSRR